MSKILIVEDDPMISEIYQKKFTEAGFEVALAASGKQVMGMVEQQKFDVILLDLIMPQMSGLDIIKTLRGGNYDQDIKIIVSSNLNNGEDREKALQSGANGFISKSEYNPSDLVKEVQGLLSRYGSRKNDDLKVDGSDKNKKATGKKRILMIEDEDIFIEIFGEKLKQDGFDVVFAKNGAWGIKEALKDNFDLILTDMVMPAMGGEEIVTKLRLEDKTMNIPIVVLSASTDDEGARKVKELGANEFFVKTKITPAELSNKISEIL